MNLALHSGWCFSRQIAGCITERYADDVVLVVETREDKHFLSCTRLRFLRIQFLRKVIRENPPTCRSVSSWFLAW